MRSNRLLTSCAFVAGFALVQSQVAHGGWTGQINGTGFGKAGVNVTSSVGAAGSAATPLMSGPSASMIRKDTFFAGAPLPTGSSSSTFASIRGSAGYVWSAVTLATGGDRTDNQTIESMVTVIPQEFAFLSLDTKIITDSNDDKFFHAEGVATGGTALLLRGFNWFGSEPPTDDDLTHIDFIFNELWVGHGVNDPSVREDGSFFSFDLPLPSNIDLETFYVTIDGLATSAMPDAGSMAVPFGITAAGLLLARRSRRS